jgi:hypothetical protein
MVVALVSTLGIPSVAISIDVSWGDEGVTSCIPWAVTAYRD